MGFGCPSQLCLPACIHPFWLEGRAAWCPHTVLFPLGLPNLARAQLQEPDGRNGVVENRTAVAISDGLFSMLALLGSTP
jgi:hypothetical protein